MDYNKVYSIINSKINFISIISESIEYDCESLRTALLNSDYFVFEFDFKSGFKVLLDFLSKIKDEVEYSKCKIILTGMECINIDSVKSINSYISREFKHINVFFVFSYFDLNPKNISFIINETYPIALTDTDTDTDTDKNIGLDKYKKNIIKLINKNEPHSDMYLERIKNIHKGLYRALIYINENYNKDMLISDVAKHACVSSSHLSYLFRELLGTTFKKTLYMVRLNNAKKIILSNPSLTLTKVANDVGFYDLSHFSKVWKKSNNETIKKYKYDRKFLFSNEI
jgi:AraC-like DNA-binding protein